MSQVPKELSIIIPAYNEEKNLIPSINQAIEAADSQLDRYELILVNDGSADKTGQIMDELASKNELMTVIHNEVNLGLGGAYKRGLAAARLPYTTWCSSDNDYPAESMIRVYKRIGEADLIIPFQEAMKHRPLHRRLISYTFTGLLNIMCGFKLKYYNGTVVFPTEQLKGISIKSNSFAFQSEALVKLLRSGLSFVEVGIMNKERQDGNSTALSFKNSKGVIRTMLDIFIEVYFKKKP